MYDEVITSFSYIKYLSKRKVYILKCVFSSVEDDIYSERSSTDLSIVLSSNCLRPVKCIKLKDNYKARK